MSARKFVAYVIALCVAIVAAPFVILYYLALYLQYIIYQLYRSYKAARLLLRYGRSARQAYLRATAIDFETFSALRNDG